MQGDRYTPPVTPPHTPRDNPPMAARGARALAGGKTGPFLFVLTSATPLHTQFLTLDSSLFLVLS